MKCVTLITPIDATVQLPVRLVSEIDIRKKYPLASLRRLIRKIAYS